MKTKSIDRIKEQRQQQIEMSVKAYAKSGDVVHLEDIEAINEHYDEILKNMQLSSYFHARNFS
ncbi:hypothetical protein [Aerococcus sp.]|uniref:hypothetical protein n=1 Tax=Aerococcus sp. TaxID=1872398 RepID=UPI0025BD2698|nr:hypothetical protein [Aerococcus sp.]MBR2130101.1 hypothetical protein [Aerococcus sp.]